MENQRFHSMQNSRIHRCARAGGQSLNGGGGGWRTAYSASVKKRLQNKNKPADPAHDNFFRIRRCSSFKQEKLSARSQGRFNVAHPFAAASVFNRGIQKTGGPVHFWKMIFPGHSAAYAAGH